MTVYIYILSDPETGLVRYVGKSITPILRFRSHCCRAGETRRERWIKRLRNRGLKPILEIIEEIPNSDDLDWQESERFWITYLRFLGFSLTNGDNGGNGGRKLTMEAREKISAGLRGRRLSPDSRAKISMAHRGKTISDETRQKLSRLLSGRKLSPEQVARLVALHKGSKHTHETLAKMRLSAKAIIRKPLSELHKQRIAEGVRSACIKRNSLNVI